MALILAMLLILASCSDRQPETVTARTADGNRRVVCYAAIEGANTCEIVLKKGAVLSHSYVEKGDFVAKGDLLMGVTVDGKEISYCAECDGVVAELADLRSVSDGKKASCSLLNTEMLQVEILLGEDAIHGIDVGDSALVEGTAFDGKGYAARVEKISSVPEPEESGVVYRTLVRLLERDESILPGMTAKVTLEVTLPDSVLLPYSAVGFDDQGYYARSPEGNRLTLTNAVYCKQGYAVNGLESGTQVARYADGGTK